MTGILNILAASISSAIADGYFNRVTLLLPGNGTNGAQNNTFLDSSSNNFTITRNGNTTQGTFSPFSQTGWSNYFDGASNVVPSSNAVAATGVFTIEAFIYVTYNTSTGSQGIYTQYAAADGGRMQLLFDDSDKKFKLTIGGSSYPTTNAYSGVYNTWVHLVASRDSSNNLTFYVNGVRDSVTASVSGSIYTSNPMIGNRNGGGIPFYGYISNLRITNTVVYSGTSITVPTSNLSSVSGTTLLTLQSNRFVDNGPSALTFTINGTPSVQAFSPFYPVVAYTPSTIGGSGYFDGTGDYLTLSSNAALAPGTGDFTIEAWLYPTAALSTYNSVYETSATNGLLFGKITSGYGVRSAGTADLISSTAPAINQWVHVAASRSGTDLRLFINGELKSTVTNSTNFATGSISLGASGSGTNPFPGYISGLRFVKGTALYTATFTVPTSPPTAVSNTNFLGNFTNAGITDATAKNVLETVGNAQISTTQSKWGGSSLAFDGTGDVVAASGAPVPIGTLGDFTAEAWIYTTSSADQTIFYLNGGTSSFAGCRVGINTNKIYLLVSTSGSAWAINSGNLGTINSNTWYHVAAVRNGGTFTLYVDGVSVFSSTSVAATTALMTGSLNYVGSANSSGVTLSFNGYIDDARVSRLARYTANFTAPTAAFALQ